jgi:hypothetical protein
MIERTCELQWEFVRRAMIPMHDASLPAGVAIQYGVSGLADLHPEAKPWAKCFVTRLDAGFVILVHH